MAIGSDLTVGVVDDDRAAPLRLPDSIGRMGLRVSWHCGSADAIRRLQLGPVPQVVAISHSVRGAFGIAERTRVLHPTVLIVLFSGTIADVAIQLAARINPAPPAASARQTPLSARETEVLVLASRSLTNDQIAGVLHISRETVKHHVSAILAKLHQRDRVGAAVWAADHGLLKGSLAPTSELS